MYNPVPDIKFWIRFISPYIAYGRIFPGFGVGGCGLRQGHKMAA